MLLANSKPYSRVMKYSSSGMSNMIDVVIYPAENFIGAMEVPHHGEIYLD